MISCSLNILCSTGRLHSGGFTRRERVHCCHTMATTSKSNEEIDKGRRRTRPVGPTPFQELLFFLINLDFGSITTYPRDARMPLMAVTSSVKGGHSRACPLRLMTNRMLARACAWRLPSALVSFQPPWGLPSSFFAFYSRLPSATLSGVAFLGCSHVKCIPPSRGGAATKRPCLSPPPPPRSFPIN